MLKSIIIVNFNIQNKVYKINLLNNKQPKNKIVYILQNILFRDFRSYRFIKNRANSIYSLIFLYIEPLNWMKIYSSWKNSNFP